MYACETYLPLVSLSHWLLVRTEPATDWPETAQSIATVPPLATWPAAALAVLGPVRRLSAPLVVRTVPVTAVAAYALVMPSARMTPNAVVVRVAPASSRRNFVVMTDGL